MKKFMTIGLMMCLICAVVNSGLALSVSAADDTKEIEKIYCNATMEDDFTEKEIIVTILPDWYDKEYTAEDFADIGCVRVKFLANGKVEGHLVKILCLTIDKEGKQAVLDAIKMLETRQDIYAAEPNYLQSSPGTGDTALMPVALLLGSTCLIVLTIRRKKNT